MLEVKNIYREYMPKKGVPVKALNNVSIKFPDKGLVFILGKSGSGKSTLLNVLGGLDRVDSGEIIIKGKSSKDFKQSDFDSYRNTYIGFVFQEYNILNEFTVGANIGLALQLQGKKATNEEINRILEEVDLVGYGKRKPNELSGGQKQRVAIARALVKEPEIIMADEPTGALDSNTGIQVFETLKKLSLNKLVIVVSHDREFAEQYGDRVIEFKDGEIISDIMKTKSAPEEKNDGVLLIDNKMISLKKGYKLTQNDLELINKYMEKNDVFITFDEKTNNELKKVSRIDESGNRETFIATDESLIKHNPNAKFELIKSKLPYKNSLKIGASALKTKRFRLFMTILLSFLAFAMFGFVDTLSSYDVAKTISTGLKERDNNYGLIEKENKIKGSSEGYYYYNKSNLSLEDQEYILKNMNVNTDLVFTNLKYKNSDYLNISETLAGHESIGTNYFYNPYLLGISAIGETRVNELGFTVDGVLPTKTNEVAITRYILEMMNKDGAFLYDKPDGMNIVQIESGLVDSNSVIGKYICLRNIESSNGFYYEITGVVDTNVDLNKNTSPYKQFMSNAYNYGDEQQKNLYNKMVYEIHKSYSSLIYVSQQFIDEEINKSNDFINVSNLDGCYFESNLMYYNNMAEEQYLWTQYLNKLSLSQERIVFFDGRNKKELADDEIILYIRENNYYPDITNVELKDEDKTYLTYGFDYTTNQVIKYESTFYSFSDYYNAINQEAIYNYALSNIPTSNLFDEYCRLYYSTYDESIDSYIEPTFEMTDELKAYAYLNMISNPYQIADDTYRYGSLSQSIWDFLYSSDGTINFFGGKSENAINKERKLEIIARYELYPKEAINANGNFGIRSGYDSGEVSKTIKIVGYAFYSSSELNEIRENAVIVSDNLYEEVNSKQYDDYRYMLFDIDEQSSGTYSLIESTYDEISLTRFVFPNEISDSVSMINSMVTSFQQIFLYVGIGFAIFAALLLMNFIATSISYKKREIGILRAVGARSKDVFTIFFNEALIIALINYILALAATITAVGFFNAFIRKELNIMGNMLIFGPRQLILMLILSVSIAIIASFLPVYNTARKKPVDAINNR